MIKLTCALGCDVNDPCYFEGIGSHIVGSLHMIRGLPVVLWIHVFINILPPLSLLRGRSRLDLDRTHNSASGGVYVS